MKVLITTGLWGDPDYYLNLGDERHRVAVKLPADDLPKLHEFIRLLAAAEHDRGSVDYLEELDLPSGRLQLYAHALRRELILDFGTTDCTLRYDLDLLERILRQTDPPCRCRAADEPHQPHDVEPVPAPQAVRCEADPGHDVLVLFERDQRAGRADTRQIEVTPAQKVKLERAVRRLRASEDHQALPANVRTAAEAHPPWFLYRIKSTGRRGVLCGIGETPDGRITFDVGCHLKYNPGWDVPKGHLVLGVRADDIEPVQVLWDVADRM